ncbi:hypothetical protein LSTR_LSTR000649 [Laodelphax striatellus]|uniref:Farnesyl pyrophosphate synthase n=1 Tax=Laodelphax striatellus TaxID=195883 RepID=A0A482XG38_LAOST|nr:hypothetical protein LSTR_LSTR000649 [Laodelphax striatellus]
MVGKEYVSNNLKRPTYSLARDSCAQWNTARTLTTLSQAAAGTAVSKDEKREFMAVFPDIVRDLTDAGRHLDIPDATKWYAKTLQYNVPGGKKNRGMALVLGYKFLANSKDLTPENMRLARILGWCVELLQGFYLVTDDIIDQATTRRGRPCWYRNPGVGLTAINDALLIESGIYQLLRRHFRNKPYYVDLIELFHDVALKTNFGQALDMLSEQTRDLKLENFTMDRYNSIVKYKTAYYTFQLPIALAMHMAGIGDEERHRQAKTILLEMGHFFQVQSAEKVPAFRFCMPGVERRKERKKKGKQADHASGQQRLSHSRGWGIVVRVRGV